jgi:hypothetical protein
MLNHQTDIIPEAGKTSASSFGKLENNFSAATVINTVWLKIFYKKRQIWNCLNTLQLYYGEPALNEYNGTKFSTDILTEA